HSDAGNQTLVGPAQVPFAQTCYHLPPCCCATITANRPGPEGYATTELSGTEGTAVPELSPRLREAIMPGFRRPARLDTVSSIAKTRVRSSAFGEILVTRP